MFTPEIKKNDVIKDYYEIEILFEKRTHYDKSQYLIK